MNQSIKKIKRRKDIWAEIKSKEQEYKRVQERINELKEIQSDISFSIQKRINEIEEIGEYLLTIEYEYFKNQEKTKK